MQVKYKEVWKIGVFRPVSYFISKTVQDTAIVTIEDDKNSYVVYRMLPFSMTFDDP